MAVVEVRAVRGMILAVLPAAFGIAVFGVVYGALAGTRLGGPMTIAASLLVFSGTVQFSLVGLADAGASAGAVLATVAALNARNLVLGAVLRPYLHVGRGRRALLAYFLVDETVGLSVAARRDAGRTLLVSGLVCGTAWLGGTVVGVAGGRLPALQPLAEAIFPVLFVALAAITSETLGNAGRAAVGAALTGLLITAVPGLAGLAPVIAAIVVAVPGRQPAAQPPRDGGERTEVER